MAKTIKILKLISLLIVLGYMVFSTLLLISYQNIVYQTVSSIDYVYASKSGGDPKISDAWLADKYCDNKVGLNIAYPQMKETCTKLKELEK